MVKEIYGKKIGMTQLFSEDGDMSAVTLIEVEPVYLLDKFEHASGPKARIGCFKLKPNQVKKLKKPLRGYFSKLKVVPYRLIREVDVVVEQKEAKDSKEVKDSKEIGVELFKPGDLVDVQALTKGKGFAGGMKRHGWSGQPKSHGSTTHRRLGSAGASAYPSRIIKGISMPGHMGAVLRTVKNLKVLKVDQSKNIIFLKGCVPGSRGVTLRLRKLS